MSVKEQLEKLIGNPELEWEFARKSELKEKVRIRFIPQGDSGYFQATFLDEQDDIVGSRIMDEFTDAIHFAEKNLENSLL